MKKLNYSAEQIRHVYKRGDEEKSETIQAFINRTGLTPKYAYGNIYFHIEDIFCDDDNNLPYTFQGYGGVDILGNVNGKTQGLLNYKSKKMKASFERLTSKMQIIEEEIRSATILVEEQHGKPNIQHCILAYD